MQRFVGRVHFGPVLLASAASIIACVQSEAADWPTWRHDANRSAVTDEALPAELQLHWKRQLPRLTPAWPEDPRIQFDAAYEPIVLGQTLFVGSSANDSVTAYDTRSGAELWRFYTDGPVRFAPIATQGRVYFGADDGCYYCLDAADGRQLWKFRAATTSRKVLGNDRLISVCPIRGGAVLADGRIHFTAGVWPFEGTFLYTLDAETGEPADDLPRSAVVTLQDLSPQGYLAISRGRLFVPCGRSVAACQDLSSGEFLKFSYSTSGTTDYHVALSGDLLFHGHVTYDTGVKKTIEAGTHRPVLTSDTAYFGRAGDLVAIDLEHPREVETKDRRGRPIKQTQFPERWRVSHPGVSEVPEGQSAEQWLAANPVGVHVKAGNRLYGHQATTIFAAELAPDAEAQPEIVWKSDIDGDVSSMVAADGRLFAVTADGLLCCFGADEVDAPTVHPLKRAEAPVAADGWRERVRRVLDESKADQGFAVVLGSASGRLIEELAGHSSLRIIALHPNERHVRELRSRFDAAGSYGRRIAAQAGTATSLSLPPYLANLIVVDDRQAAGWSQGREFLQSVFQSLRPYGGTACFELSDDEHAELVRLIEDSGLHNAGVQRAGGLTILRRVGALPGSADWTHEYGDPSNTLMSHDRLVKAPLGVLWFGGPASSGELFYNRHYWGPSMSVVEGRMFIQGPGKLTAVDVYTGCLLWQIPLEEQKDPRAGRRGNNFERVLAGFNFLTVKDGLYLADGKVCRRIDPVSGKVLAEFRLPDESDWGRMRVVDDLMIVEAFRMSPSLKQHLPVELLALNRYSGDVVWQHAAEFSLPFVAIGEDRVYCFDGVLEDLYLDWKRRGLVPKAAEERYLKALDLQTGEVLWKYTTDMVVTWLGYSGEHDVLLSSNKHGIAAYRGQSGQELWKKYEEGKGFKGHPESVWDKVIVWNDRIIDQRGPGAAYELETGEPITRLHPITGAEVPWEFTKSGHHCNYAIASPHLLTFRAASAGYTDLESGSTARLEGFRSGCRNSLIPANGVLNSPNFAHGCVCGYSLFTSLAFVHLPESEMWSYSALKLDEQLEEQSVERIGVNLGAPGDRLSETGTLWLDHPNVGGSSPPLNVQLSVDDPRWFRRHSSLVEGGELPWVAASGVIGLTSLTIPLSGEGDQSRRYTVRLHFLEPDSLEAGQRVFDVHLQGQAVLENLDVVAQAGGSQRALVKEFTGIEAQEALVVDFTARAGEPLICGVEVVAED